MNLYSMEKIDNIRQPVVAGTFYPSSSQQLKNKIETLIGRKPDRQDAIACMLPHAGYVYSGSVAAATLSSINIKEKIILLGPNHTGAGAEYSIMTQGIWQTPLGEVSIDADLAGRILSGSKYLKSDEEAHMHEHSIEVEIPFLQYIKKDFQIVPIIFLSDDFSALKNIGKEIASSIQKDNLKDSVTIIASSDMTHYEPQEDAERKDKEAIQAILELNEDKLIDKILKLNISMCGYAPVIAMIAAAKALGAKSAKLVKYQTSGEVTQDKTSVVGYAGIIVS